MARFRRHITALLRRLILALLRWLVALGRLLILLRIRELIVALPIELDRRCGLLRW